jgi:hypothetical protein
MLNIDISFEDVFVKPILVQMSDEQWTLEALHLASAFARNVGGKIVLLHLALANNPGLLGWGMGPPSEAEQHLIKEYAAVAEDYGVMFCVQPMQFVVLVDALAQAAENLKACVLFADIPHSHVPLWRRFRLWNLKRQLGDCRLCLLDGDQPFNLEKPIPSTVIWDKITHW